MLRSVSAVRPTLDVCDDSFVVLAPARIAPLLGRPDFLRRALPSLVVSLPQDRGKEGRRWKARSGRLGRRWDGTAEVWLEPWQDGTLVHLYVRLEPRRGCGTARARDRRARRLQDRLRRTWKRALRRSTDGTDDRTEAAP